MTTRPQSTRTDTPGASQDGAPPFAGLGAGLGFFQDWMKAAGAAMPGMPSMPGQTGAAMPGVPGVPAWTMPTLDPEELDKRIQELKTVQFWLEQNSRMIEMTIQGMEVQKMTLSTLKGMNVSMDALRDSLKATAPTPTAAQPSAPAAASTAASTASATEAAPDAAANAAANDLINPMRWWDALTQQFSHLAGQASQTAQTMGETVEASVQDMVAKAKANVAPVAAAAAEALKPTPAHPKASTAAGKTPARKQAATKSARKAPPKA